MKRPVCSRLPPLFRAAARAALDHGESALYFGNRQLAVSEDAAWQENHNRHKNATADDPAPCADRAERLHKHLPYDRTDDRPRNRADTAQIYHHQPVDDRGVAVRVWVGVTQQMANECAGNTDEECGNAEGD